MYLRSCHFLLFFLLFCFYSGDVMQGTYLCILRKYLQRYPHSSLTCNYFTYRQKELEKLKRPTSPALCLRRDSGTVTSYLETSLWTSFLIVASSERVPNTLLTQCELTDFPIQFQLDQPCSRSLDWRRASALTNAPGAASLTQASP